MALYNLRTIQNYYQITKFDNDLNVEHTYEATEAKCNCPAGTRGRRCRHIQMIQIFTSHGRVNEDWFLNFDSNKWVKPWTNEEETVKPFRRRT